MTERRSAAMLRSLALFSVVIALPALIIGIGKLQHAASGVPAPKFIFLVWIVWKFLIYPHNLAWLHERPVLPGALAPVIAFTQWTIIAIATAGFMRDRRLLVQLVAAVAAIVLIGFLVQFGARLSGVSFPIE